MDKHLTHEVRLPDDLFQTIEEFDSYAIDAAREQSEIYALPCAWTAVRLSGNVGDNEIVYSVRQHWRAK